MTKAIKKILKGVVVSDKNPKTLIVSVTRLKEHPVYKKRYKVTTRYKAHDEKGEFKLGEQVLIRECRPLSKDKRWRVISKI